MDKKYPKKQGAAEAAECHDWGPGWACCCVPSGQSLHLSEPHCPHLTDNRGGPVPQQVLLTFWCAGKQQRQPAKTAPLAHWGRSPCCLWGRVGRLRDPPDSGRHPAGWRRTCLSSGRRPPSRPAAPAGEVAASGQPGGWDGAGPVLQKDTGRWLEGQRSAERGCYATMHRGPSLDRGWGTTRWRHRRHSARPGLARGQPHRHGL